MGIVRRICSERSQREQGDLTIGRLNETLVGVTGRFHRAGVLSLVNKIIRVRYRGRVNKLLIARKQAALGQGCDSRLVALRSSRRSSFAAILR